MTDKMTTGERLGRLERAIAEITRWHKGDWTSRPSDRSAAGEIMAEQRTIDGGRQAEREAKAAELRRQLEEVSA